MMAEHVAALYFSGRAEAAKKRLQKLKAAGVIGERPRRPYEPAILFLTSKAFKLLRERGTLADYPKLEWTSLEKRAQVSDLTLRHELEVMAVKAAMVPAITAREGFSVAEFSTWPLLFQFQARRPATASLASKEVLVKPDGYIRVHEKEPDGGLSEHTFFLEVDRSTETQATLAQRAACYRDYYTRGGLAARNGKPRSVFADFPFRVLMVFKNAERRNNTAETLLQTQPSILTQVWLTTFAEATADPLGPIWIRPLDYREATKGTPFDPTRRRDSIYRRQSEREAQVDASVGKHRLLVQRNTTIFPERHLT